MLNFILRRLTKFILPAKVVLLIGSVVTLGYLVIKTPPELGNIVIFSLVLFIFLSILFSFLLTAFAPRSFSEVGSLLTALCVSFLLFLKAVGLLSPLNIGLFIVFLILLGLYLRKERH